jgi:uncharacterized protein involved in exopolysaccharide biosynthesis
MMEQTRMMRNVEIQQAVFIELTKQLEIAKIDEIKDTPVVNFREEAKDSVLPAGPRRALILIIFVFVSFIATSMYFIFSPQISYYKNLLKQSTTKV